MHRVIKVFRQGASHKKAFGRSHLNNRRSRGLCGVRICDRLYNSVHLSLGHAFVDSFFCSFYLQIRFTKIQLKRLYGLLLLFFCLFYLVGGHLCIGSDEAQGSRDLTAVRLTVL